MIGFFSSLQYMRMKHVNYTMTQSCTMFPLELKEGEGCDQDPREKQYYLCILYTDTKHRHA